MGGAEMTFFVEEFSCPRGACGGEPWREAHWYTLLPSRSGKGFRVCVLLPPTADRESLTEHFYISRKNSCIVHISVTGPSLFFV